MKAKKNPSGRQPPRPPRAPVIIDQDGDDDDDREELEASEADNTDLDEELRALDEELGADASTAKVVVHKVVPNGESARCFSCPRPQFFSDQIREQWGPGTYSILVYLKGKIKARHRLTFAEPMKPAAAASPAAPADTSSTLRDLEARFDRDRARDLELMKLIVGARPQADPLQMQAQILSMMTTVKELTGGANAKSSGSDRSAIDLVLEGVKLAQRLGNGGAGGEGTNWGEVALGVVEGVKALTQTNAASPSATPALPAPASAERAAVAAPEPAPGAGETEEPNMLEKFRTHLQFLVRKAASGSDPELYADVAIDNLTELPEFMRALALDYLQRPDALDRLIKIEPAIGSHREWFQRCIEAIREQIREANSPPDPPDPLTDGGDSPEAGD